MTNEPNLTSADSPLDETEAQLDRLAAADRASAPTDLEDRLFATTRRTLKHKAPVRARSTQPPAFAGALRLVFPSRLLAAAAIVLLVLAVGVTLRARRSAPGANTTATTMSASIDDELNDWLALLNDSESDDTLSTLTDVTQALERIEADLASPWSLDSFEFDTESL